MKVQLAFACLVLLAVPAGAQHTTLPEPPGAVMISEPEDDLRARLQDELPRLLQKAEIPGISISVIRDGQLYWTGTAGMANLSEPALVTADTVFQAASLSKPVFAYLVLKLSDRGLIDLDKPLATYLPYPRLEHDERYRKITARMILSHTSGLPNWALGQDHIPFQFSPAEAWGYSGEGYVYLQKVVEKLTGSTLPELARKEVFEPFGMVRSSFVWDSEISSAAAVGVNELGGVERINSRGEANAAASLLTTARDYGRFLVALLAGRGLKPETREAMFKPQAQVPSKWGEPNSPKQAGVFWGLGWGLEQARGEETLWHWGHQDAWRAYVAVRRDGRSGVVYFTNGSEGLSIAQALSDLVIGGPRPGLDWLNYEQYDDPKRFARKEMERALAQSTEAGLRRYRELRASSPQVADSAFVRNLADRLLERNQEAQAVALLRAALVDEPRSAELNGALGQALTGTGELQLALLAYETATRLNPEKQWPVMRKWLQEGIDANPVELPEEQLIRLAGSYGPRQITAEGGRLYYQREGRPRYRLIPVSPTLFQVEGNGSFRVRFAEDASKLTVIQPDGEDESARINANPPRP
ncbi:MAG TPA: serine hydrolase [Thermoanaerobaculia bacterium]|nr:serine hydrolase [Thermoanaerobaculia bacterium]